MFEYKVRRSCDSRSERSGNNICCGSTCAAKLRSPRQRRCRRVPLSTAPLSTAPLEHSAAEHDPHHCMRDIARLRRTLSSGRAGARSLQHASGRGPGAGLGVRAGPRGLEQVRRGHRVGAVPVPRRVLQLDPHKRAPAVGARRSSPPPRRGPPQPLWPRRQPSTGPGVVHQSLERRHRDMVLLLIVWSKAVPLYSVIIVPLR